MLTTLSDVSRKWGRTRRPWLRVLGVLAMVALVAVTMVYAWPLRSPHLMQATATTLSFTESKQRVDAAVSGDVSDPTVESSCSTRARLHGKRTVKAVLMLHGYTGCPVQMDALAERFFDQGYNVFVPRAPRHGLVDSRAHGGLRAKVLVDYANDALTVTTGLGDEVGVVGVSGGALLATWLAEYRTDSVAHLLALSPFYAPSTQQVPAWQVKPAIVLYGNRLLPDHFDDVGFSYSALAQYLRIARNLRDDPVSDVLSSVAVVTSANDRFIDRKRAVEVPRGIAASNNRTLGQLEIPAAWNIGHDTADPEELGAHTRELTQSYLDLYEGRSASAS